MSKAWTLPPDGWSLVIVGNMQFRPKKKAAAPSAHSVCLPGPVGGQAEALLHGVPGERGFRFHSDSVSQLTERFC